MLPIKIIILLKVKPGMSNKKSVVILGSAFPLRGGLASYNERICRAFTAQGYDARIETFSLQYPSFLFPGKTQYSEDSPPADLNISVKVNSINPFNWWKIGRKLRKEKPDLIIVKFWLPFMGPCFGTIARIAKKNKHTKIISILDNIIPHEKRTGDRSLTKYFVKPVDGFIAMSKSVMEDLNTFDKIKPRIFSPHPLYDNFGKIIPKDKAREFLDIEKDTKLILFFGLIRDYKGLDLLLEAMAKNSVLSEGVKLLVAGEFYSNDKYYYELVEKLSLNDAVRFTNSFVPDSEVAYYFCASDLVVQPYKSATQSGVTQIAYHFNKPMVVTSVGGLPEIVPDGVTGFVVEPDASEIADAINKFFAENLNETFVNNIIEEKKKYSWDIMVEAIESLIQLNDDNQK